MATSRVRHRGHPPRDIDHGPSNGAGQGGAIGSHAEVARLSAYAPSKLVGVGERLEGGAGAIERRQATEAQREAWRREADGPPARSPIEDIPTAVPWGSGPAAIARRHESRMRGGERNRQLVAASRAPLIHLADPPVTPPPKEPVMATEPSPPVIQRAPESQAIADLTAAASRVDAAWEAFHAADAERIRAEGEYEVARRQLARAMAAVHDAFALHDGSGAPAGPGPELSVAERRHERLTNGEPAEDASESSTDIPQTIPEPHTHAGGYGPPFEAAARMAAIAGGRAERAAAGGPAAHATTGNGRGKLASGLTRRQEQVLEVVRRHRGDRAAAAKELRVRYQSVNTVLEAIGRAGKLPTELIAQLPAAFAKYTGV